MFTTQHSQERFYDPSEGTVCLDGVSVSAHDLSWLRRNIGVVSQDPTMFAGTVAENIAYARPHASRAEVEAAAAAANPQGGRAEWMKRLRERVLPPLRAFKPDLLIISAGFDAANHDVGNAGVDKTGKRLAGINLQPDDYEEMTAYLCAAAGSSNARVVSVLEGGYGYLTGDAKDGAAGLIREGLASCVVGHREGFGRFGCASSGVMYQ